MTRLELHNQYISASNIQFLTGNSPALEIFALTRCREMNDPLVAQIIQTCSKLRKLTFNYCSELTEAIFPMINRPFLKVSSLSVVGCEKFNKGAHAQSVLKGELVTISHEFQSVAKSIITHSFDTTTGLSDQRTVNVITLFTNPSVIRTIELRVG